MSNEDEEFGVGPDGGWKITALDLWQLYSYVTDLQLPAKMASRHYVRWERKYDKKLARALEKFTERFDTILIDEAQDISEVGFRYAMALKDSDASLFLAIGEGQSLYQDDLAPSLIQWMSQVDDDRHLFRSFRKSHASDLVIKAFVDHGIDNEAATKSLENIRREQKAQKSAGQPQGHGTIDQIRNAGSITLREREGSSLVKLVKKIAEDGRVAVRNIRRDSNDELKKMESSSDITEDDLKLSQKEVQDITDEFIVKINNALEQKEKEIMEV